MPTIAKLLKQEGLSGSRRGIDKFLKRFRETGPIARQPGLSFASTSLFASASFFASALSFAFSADLYDLHFTVCFFYMAC